MDTYVACHFSILIAVKFPYYSHKESVNIWIYHESDTTHTRPVSLLTINENRLEAERYTFFFSVQPFFFVLLPSNKIHKTEIHRFFHLFPPMKLLSHNPVHFVFHGAIPDRFLALHRLFFQVNYHIGLYHWWSLFGSIETLYFGRIYCCVIVIAMRMEAQWKM